MESSKVEENFVATSILSKTRKENLSELLDLVQEHIQIDRDLIISTATGMIQSRKQNMDLQDSPLKQLETDWYNSLASGNPDYGVYGRSLYAADIWGCWVLYSRQALKAIQAPLSAISKSIIEELGQPKNIYDLGCGFGYTTAAIKEIFPSASVFGTNLEGTWQFKVAQKIGQQRGFEVVGKPQTRGDVVFASEYFEHFNSPIDHAYEVLSIVRPKHIIVANSFNGRAIGHFNTYFHKGAGYSGRKIGRMFNASLRWLGYEKIKTKMWNDRPSVWSREK